MNVFLNPREARFVAAQRRRDLSKKLMQVASKLEAGGPDFSEGEWKPEDITAAVAAELQYVDVNLRLVVALFRRDVLPLEAELRAVADEVEDWGDKELAEMEKGDGQAEATEAKGGAAHVQV